MSHIDKKYPFAMTARAAKFCDKHDLSYNSCLDELINMQKEAITQGE